VRKPINRKAATAKAQAADQAPGSFFQRKDIVAGALAFAAATAIVANAAFLQAGKHPAPMFAGKTSSVAVPATPKSIRVVGEEITGPPPLPVAAPKVRPAESELPKVEPAAPASGRPRNEVIADIQRELSRRGFYDGTIDGVHGPKTDAAMRDFEQAAGLKPGSEPNDVFLRALTRSQAKASAPAAASTAQASRNDPIAELIAPSSKRVLAVQRALAEYGYGQIKPNGTFGPETKDAIEQFERARKMPITGQISPRLVRELSALTGRQME
jgi:peptidoglycan hydrolase-like protein with peptidoglycan-binding domain